MRSQPMTLMVISAQGHFRAGRSEPVRSSTWSPLKTVAARCRPRPGPRPQGREERFALPKPQVRLAQTVQRVLAAVDVTRPSGLRDRAILLLLIRLGLRAGEVAALAVNGIDWPQRDRPCSRQRRTGATRLRAWWASALFKPTKARRRTSGSVSTRS